MLTDRARALQAKIDLLETMGTFERPAHALLVLQDAGALIGAMAREIDALTPYADEGP